MKTLLRSGYMQQKMCFSYQVFKVATPHDAVMYILEFMARLQFVTQARPPNVSAYNNTSFW
jgi:hypothetical protein